MWSSEIDLKIHSEKSMWQWSQIKKKNEMWNGRKLIGDEILGVRIF